MAAIKEQKNKEPRPSGIGPGDRLQAARIEQGLSIDDVANRMHLSGYILVALEENEFDEITAPIFVKGYLRAYARIVSLDEDDMIQQYLDFYSDEDPPINSTSNMAPEISSSDARVKWTTFLVIIGLGALLAVWWWNQERVMDDPISLDTKNSVMPSSNDNTVVAAVEIEAVSENAPQAVEVIETPEVQLPKIAQLPAAVPVEAPLKTPVKVSPEVEVAGNSVSASSPAIEPELKLEKIAQGGAVITRMAASGEDKLRLIVHADTWADIEDASGFRLVYDLLRANQKFELTGAAPFTAFFGNGHGVEIKLNERAIELTPIIRDDNTARLKIGS